MKDAIRDQHWMFRGAVTASLALHLVVGWLAIFGLPISLPQPEEEQAIAVDLVPPEPPKEAKAEPPPPAEEPKPEKSQEAKAEPPPPARDDAGRHEPAPVLRPVFRFGEKDMGPRKTANGNSAEDGSASSTAQHAPSQQDVAEPSAMPTIEALSEAVQPAPPEVPDPKPTEAVKAKKEPPLQEAKMLFSQAATGDPTSATAMNDVPRDVRAGRLCVTELREQLLHALPPYFPELLPSHRLEDGTVIEITRTAFRASRQWFNLSYRCEVDPDVTKVVAFAFHVGEPVPRSEWQRRGLPSQ